MENQIEKAEKIILGTILGFQEYQERIISDLKPEYFSNDVHSQIFKKVAEIRAKGGKIDILTVVNEFSKPDLEKIGGAYYISSLTNNVASGYNYDAHIKIIKDNYIRTNLINLFNSEISKLTDRMNDIADTQVAVSSMMDDLFSIPSASFFEINEIISNRFDDYERAANSGNSLIGINTGHSKLNKITNGWQSGDLIILAARPSMGKTAVSLYFAKCPAKEGKRVLYFSLEMPKERLIDRIISTDTNIDSIKLQSGKIDESEWEQLSVKSGAYGDNTLMINDDSGMTIEDITHSSLTEAAKGDIDLILIDYLQLIKYSGGGVTTNDKVAHISKGCKALAKKIGCPVIALSQLSRAVEARGGDKRPELSDLRDSGSIEQDADVILFLYRPVYYGFETNEEGGTTEGLIEIMVKKNRNGSLGNTDIHHNENWSYIGELPFAEMNSMVMPFSINEGIEPNFDEF